MITVPKPGNTKQELLRKLETLKSSMSDQIEGNEISLTQITDGYSVKAAKKILFMTFFVDAEIIAKDGEYSITYQTNAPQSKVDEALAKVKEVLEKL